MSDTLTASLFFVIGMAAILGIAYLLDRRRVAQTIGRLPHPLGPAGRILLWTSRLLVAVMLLSMVGAWFLRSLPLAWLAGISTLLGLINGFIPEAVREVGQDRGLQANRRPNAIEIDLNTRRLG